ncbi:MAG: hypothetical protein ACI39H_00125 [Lachnospiraceae bacterium]
MKNKLIQYSCQGLLSSEMENYVAENISERESLKIITGASIPIREKRERLEQLISKAEDLEVKDDIQACIDHISNALAEIEDMAPDSFIMSQSCWYDIEDGSSLDHIHRTGSESFLKPSSSFEELIQDILDEIEDNTDVRDFGADKSTWYEFVIWNKVKLPNGRVKYEEGHYCYVMIGPEVCYIEPSNHRLPGKYGSDYWGFLAGSSDLNLPVPFKSGDIVTLDCSPFADPCHMLILSAENNWDCCGLRGAFTDEEGKLHIDSVKHGHCFPMHYISRLSPLYRMSLYTGPLSENEMVIK